MGTEVLIWIVLVAFLALCFLLRARANKPDMDPFMRQIASEKARTDASVATALQQHGRELEKRFADDVRLKERLSQFARANKLDEALIALWEEIKHYPAWSSRDDFDKYNKLHLSGISGSEENDTASVEFIQDTKDYGPKPFSITRKFTKYFARMSTGENCSEVLTQSPKRFKITERTWRGVYGLRDEFYADFSFFEDGDEVFAISCSVDYENGPSYRCRDVSAFKKRGSWAKVLLKYYGQLQIERNKSSAKFRYFRADEIKSRFKE